MAGHVRDLPNHQFLIPGYPVVHIKNVSKNRTVVHICSYPTKIVGFDQS